MSDTARGMRVTIRKDGPYLVSGRVPMANLAIRVDDRGESTEWGEGERYPLQEQYALCRCGHSATKPFCDAAHKRIGFDGTETASRRPYLEEARRIDGPSISLTDAESLCAYGRFCDAQGTAWRRATEAGREAAEVVKRESRNCPGGRLVAWENAAPLEPEYAPSIGLVEDPALGVSGGILVRGGIELVGADGARYETRNRMALCRCGASRNKPFCDGSHAEVKFRDDL